MTTSIFTILIIKSTLTPGLNGASFPKLISRYYTLDGLCACAAGLILTLPTLPSFTSGLCLCNPVDFSGIISDQNLMNTIFSYVSPTDYL